MTSGIGVLLAQRGKLQGWQLLKAGISLLLLINTQLFSPATARAAPPRWRRREMPRAGGAELTGSR